MQLVNQLREAGAHSLLDRIQDGAPSMLNLKSEVSTVFLNYLCENGDSLPDERRRDLVLIAEDLQRIIDAAYLEHRTDVFAPVNELLAQCKTHATAC